MIVGSFLFLHMHHTSLIIVSPSSKRILIGGFLLEYTNLKPEQSPWSRRLTIMKILLKICCKNNEKKNLTNTHYSTGVKLLQSLIWWNQNISLAF